MHLAQFTRVLRGRALTALTFGALSMSLGACGGVIKFSDKTPITVRGPAPAAPAPALNAAVIQNARVAVTKDRIEIKEKIQFELNKATIKEESHSLLNEIASVLKQNAYIKKVDIVGHTSDEGSDSYNQKLSDNRAKAVLEYLTGQGIEASRLKSKGLGESQPIGDNKTEEGREKNRRVEFIIVEQDLGGAQ